MLPRVTSGPESDLRKGWANNVTRALSLIPDAVKQMMELSAAHYRAMNGIMNDLEASGGRALSRMEIELIAARISSANKCFY